MAKRGATKTAEQRDTATPNAVGTWEASLNAAHTETRIKITGALPGGHNCYVIAERPDGRREDFGPFTWDGDRGDLILPFVAIRVRVMNDYEDVDRIETLIDVLQDFIEDNQPPDPEARSTE